MFNAELKKHQQKEDPIVGSKEELLELIHREEAIIEPFRLHESSDAHKLTNYWHWYHAKQPYDIVAKFHDKYEPYVIVRFVYFFLFS